MPQFDHQTSRRSESDRALEPPTRNQTEGRVITREVPRQPSRLTSFLVGAVLLGLALSLAAKTWSDRNKDLDTDEGMAKVMKKFEEAKAARKKLEAKIGALPRPTSSVVFDERDDSLNISATLVDGDGDVLVVTMHNRLDGADDEREMNRLRDGKGRLIVQTIDGHRIYEPGEIEGNDLIDLQRAMARQLANLQGLVDGHSSELEALKQSVDERFAQAATDTEADIAALGTKVQSDIDALANKLGGRITNLETKWQTKIEAIIADIEALPDKGEVESIINRILDDRLDGVGDGVSPRELAMMAHLINQALGRQQYVYYVQVVQPSYPCRNIRPCFRLFPGRGK